MKNTEKSLKICPLCNAEYYGVPALSRLDNETKICPDCGCRQSLESMGISAEEREKIIAIMHRYSPS